MKITTLGQPDTLVPSFGSMLAGARCHQDGGQLIGKPLDGRTGTAMLLLLKNLLFTAVAPGTVAVYVPLLIAENRSPVPPGTFAIALALFVVGGAIYAWCVWDFATFGRGTPAPIDAPKKLVTRGLYRCTRNPMYVGVLTVILGWAVLFQSAPLAIYALFVGGCFHLFIVSYEERRLKRQFGGEYDDYCAQVGRWLPRRFRRAAA